MSRLLTVAEAATQLGVPRASLRSAAEQHGLLVRMGRAVRIDPDDLKGLVEKCRENPQAHGSISGAVAPTSSATANDSCQRGREIADKLIGRSPGTSPKRTGPPAQVHPIK